MIFYYSATGNSKYVARFLADVSGEKTIDMVSCIRAKRYLFRLEKGERIGIVSPVYFWGLPVSVREFMKKLQIQKASGGNYVFLVSTYGNNPGGAQLQLEKALNDAGVEVNAYFGIKMPGTWTPLYDLSVKSEIEKRLSFVKAELNEMAILVRGRSNGDYSKKTSLVVAPLGQIVYRKLLSTTKFSVSEKCIGCGLCSKCCPVKCIEIRDGRPVWTEKKCDFCLSCLHHCPEFAISYGENTKKHGQYVCPL